MNVHVPVRGALCSMNSTGKVAGQLPLGDRGTLLSHSTNTPAAGYVRKSSGLFGREVGIIVAQTRAHLESVQRVHRIRDVHRDRYILAREYKCCRSKRSL